MAFELRDEGDYLRLRIVGTWGDRADSRLLREQIALSPHWRPGGRVLYDLRDLVVSTAPRYDEMRDRLEQWRALAPASPKIAALVSSPAAFGFARMLQQLWGAPAVAIFEHEAPGLAWLLTPDEIPPA